MEEKEERHRRQQGDDHTGLNAVGMHAQSHLGAVEDRVRTHECGEKAVLSLLFLCTGMVQDTVRMTRLPGRRKSMTTAARSEAPKELL
jgi:hypothetical protein